MLHSVYDQPDNGAAQAQFDRLIDYVQVKLSAVAARLDVARADILAVTDFPKDGWTQIRFNDPAERLKREIRRRTDAMSIFLQHDAITRLIGAVLAEQTDDGPKCAAMAALELLTRCRPTPTPPPSIRTEPSTRRHPLPDSTHPDLTALHHL